MDVLNWTSTVPNEAGDYYHQDAEGTIFPRYCRVFFKRSAGELYVASLGGDPEVPVRTFQGTHRFLGPFSPEHLIGQMAGGQ